MQFCFTKTNIIMKNIILVVATSLFFVINSFSQTPANDPHWNLLWKDDFNSLDLNRWKVEDNFDHWGQVQVFLKDNVTTNAGNLEITVKKEIYSCPPWAISQWHCNRQFYTGNQYFFTSGQIETKSPYFFKHGYIEAKIKLPYDNDIWPAFWTYRGLNTYSNEAEIDIVEPTGQQGSGIFGTNVHKSYPPSAVNFPQDIAPANGFNYGDWHTYAVEWTPSKIIWYLDDAPIRILPNHGVIDPVKTILNVSLKDEIINSLGVPSPFTQFPRKMYVDYVKVYQLKNDCETSLNVCNYNFSAHDNRVKNEIIIGNGTCTNSLQVGDNVYLRAAEGITINGDFTVPVGAELYIDANPCYQNEPVVDPNEGPGSGGDIGPPMGL